MPAARQHHHVPEAIRSLSTMADPDYLDLFTLTARDASDWSPEQWARAMLEDVAGRKGQILWRGLLGLRLERRGTPDCVAGWKIADRGDGWVRLGARSWFLTAHLIVEVRDGQVSLATFMQYDRPLAARVWTRVSARHRTVAPGLLQQAHHVLRSRTR
ncbi:hypothetical protein [Streptomyces sp. NPDC053427]|uniref:hypothetical protein n=1 Tax=Streptomyces sp. NPDC053427 TaxID=3365701 RepID=UPI0037D929FC